MPLFERAAQRAFSNDLMAKEFSDVDTGPSSQKYMSLIEQSKYVKTNMHPTEEVAMETTVSSQRKQNMFNDLANIQDNEHPHLKFVKGKISKLVAEELEYLGFKD